MSERARKPGWYVDDNDVRYQRFWDGAEWSAPAPIPPSRPKPQGLTTRKVALGVALGIGAAMLGFVIVDNVTGPSDAECAIQQAQYQFGQRPAWKIHGDCR